MSRQFDAAVNVALEIERELRVLTPDRPSLRCFIAECLTRAGVSYEEVEAQKERLAEDHNSAHSGSAAYVRHLVREIAGGRLREPPEKERIGRMYWNQKDQAVLELGGHAEKLFLLWVVAAELAYQQNADVFGTVEDLAAHKARIAELEAKRKDLHERIARSWDTSDIILGPIASDFTALVSWRRAPGCPVGKDAIAERLVEHLLAQEGEAGEAKAA